MEVSFKNLLADHEKYYIEKEVKNVDYDEIKKMLHNKKKETGEIRNKSIKRNDWINVEL